MSQVHSAPIVRTQALLLAILMAISVLLVGAMPAAAKKPETSGVDFELTILHNNDGESKLREAYVPLPPIPPATTSPGPDLTKPYAGVARFASLVALLKEEALSGPPATSGAKRGVVMLSSGDNFLAGAEFTASLEKGVPFYDSIALGLIGYDAIAIGNHEFDFGPDVLADFIRGFTPAVPFLSANLDVSAEPSLVALEDQGRIAASTVVKERGEWIGIIGATTPQLPNISSPRDVVVGDVAPAVQAEVERLEAAGVNKIILISHLQAVDEDLVLAGELSGVDVMIAGGGDELLASPGDVLSPGDTPSLVQGTYPLTATDADGQDLPVITTAGDYKYVGRLVVGFDKSGNVVNVDEERSGPIAVVGFDPTPAIPQPARVTPTEYTVVQPDPQVQAQVVDPVNAYVADLAANVLAHSEVPLDGQRPFIRQQETNLGNLTADSQLWQAQQLAANFGVDAPQIGLQTSGGIRNNSVIPAGDISELHTFQILAFANFVSVMEDLPRDQLKVLLETSVSAYPADNGRFGQWAGLSFTFDADGPARVIDPNTCAVSAEGSRVTSITVGGTEIFSGGVWSVPETWTFDIAGNDFTFREGPNGAGGDCYDFGDAVPFTTLGVTYQQALVNYLVEGLGGEITAAQYPVVNRPPTNAQRVIPS